MFVRSIRSASSLSLSLVLFVACGGEFSENADSQHAALTYYRDVKPLIDEKCAGCHQEGQIGAGPLVRYEDVEVRAAAVKAAVESRLMPPWQAGEGCNDYRYDFSLDDAQIALIADWVDAGAPAGDPEQEPPPSGAEPPVLSRVDHTLRLPVPYVPEGEDDYRCFMIDWPEDQTTFVTGFGVRPDNPSTVHHVIAYYIPPALVELYEALDAADPGPGYTCFGGPGELTSGVGFFAAWAPGVPPADMPAGTGVRVEPGSKVVVQMHYNTVGWDGEPDQTSLDIKTDRTVDKEGWYQFFADPAWALFGQMPIPAGDPDVTHEFAADMTTFLNAPIDVHAAAMHMHTRGVSGRLSVERAAGSEECMLDIPRWDFDWQYGFQLRDPMRLQPGDLLKLRCNWDNSASNQPTVGGMRVPPVELNWGEGTNDEMCVAALYMTL